MASFPGSSVAVTTDAEARIPPGINIQRAHFDVELAQRDVFAAR